MPGSAGPLIATATGNSDPLVFVCGAGQGSSDLVGLWYGVRQLNENATLPGSITDTRGGSWIIGTTGFDPTIGTIQDGSGITNIQCGMAVRSGTPLQAGDTITVTWDPAIGAPDGSCIIVQGIVGVGGVATQSIFGDPPEVFYGNGDSKESTGPFAGDTSFLAWESDSGFDLRPDTVVESALLGAYLSLDGGAFTPYTGTALASLSSGSITLTATLTGDIAAATTFEPGGTFTAAGAVVVGNYQFVTTSGGPPPPPGPGPRPGCTRCGSGLMGLVFRQ